MITALVAYVCNVGISLPLDTQGQNNAVMTFKGFLTLVGGASVPHLRKREQRDAHNATRLKSWHVRVYFVRLYLLLLHSNTLTLTLKGPTIPDFRCKTRMWAGMSKMSPEIGG